MLLCSKGNSAPKGTENANVIQATKEVMSEPGSAAVQVSDLVTVSHSSHTSNYLLKQKCKVLTTAKVKVCVKNGKYSEATLLFDPGSDNSYVSSKLVKKVRPRWVASEHISYSVFCGK